MTSDTSDVFLNPFSTSTSSLQNLAFDGGKLWSIKLDKFLSVNSGVVKADNNDTSGASIWSLGISFLKDFLGGFLCLLCSTL